MSYNVRYFAHSMRGAGSTKKCLDAVARAIANLSSPPDLVCLQEVETRSIRAHFSLSRDNPEHTQFDVLMESLDRALVDAGQPVRYRGFYFPAHRYEVRGARPIYTTGLAVLAAQDLDVHHDNSTEPHDITHRGRSFVWLKQARICAHLRGVDRDGQSFDVFNTHLSLPSWSKTPGFFKPGRPNMGYGPNQKEEIDRLVEFVQAKQASDRFFLVGDFNSLPDSPAYNHLLARLPLRDPFPSYTGHTPAELRSIWPTAGFMHLRMRLDHVFVGNGVECVDFEDSHPFGDSGGRWHGLSDHVPLLGRFGT